jgi:AcrR family transcriptional regulator
VVRLAKRRAYHSQLRKTQSYETRRRILDATVRVMADGLAGLYIPAVAREAGVSIATVYRHFPTKRDLLAAMYPHIASRMGIDSIPQPQSLDDVRPWVRAIVERYDALDDVSRAAMASPGAAAVRHATMPARYERIRGLADSTAPKLKRADGDRITRLLVVLSSSASVRMWRDHLGLSPDEIAEEVDWIVRAAMAAANGAGN